MNRAATQSEAIRSNERVGWPSEPDGLREQPALVVEHLGKRFGDRVAFDDVSFEVGYGEVFGFLGPNGAGKTTTVRTLGTLIAPTSGSASVAGIPSAQRTARRSGRGSRSCPSHRACISG